MQPKNLLFAAAEVKADTVEPPALALVPLPSGALAAVAAQLRQYITAREQGLLAVADKAATAAPTAATDDQLAQQWQVRHRVCMLNFTRPIRSPNTVRNGIGFSLGRAALSSSKTNLKPH